jgi:hypothetical protein
MGSRRSPGMPRLACLAILAILCMAGCRAKGLPEPPPGQDPADPEAAIPAWRPAENPLDRSAFGPEEPAGPTGHEGHGHHHHAPKAEPQPAPDDAPDNAPPSRPTDHDHEPDPEPDPEPDIEPGTRKAPPK